jgi:uncharacterized protein
MVHKFIVDVHLGKLAKLLRLMGFDTLYQNNFTIEELQRISLEQDRIILSRNNLLATKTNKFCLITDQHPVSQLKQVYVYFQLADHIRPFTRCIICNGMLETVSKESIINSLQKNTFAYFNEFWHCTDCNRIYWKGSHYDNMLKIIQSISTATM